MEMQPNKDNCDFSGIEDALSCDKNVDPNQSIFGYIPTKIELLLKQGQHVFESPPSSPLSDATTSMELRISPDRAKRSKKGIYGRGFEHNKLLNLPHYNEPYEDLCIYKALGSPNKDDLISLGRMYNKRFVLEIKSRKFPKYQRDHSRLKGLTCWFFEDNKKIVIPWLKEIGKITSQF